MKQPVNPQIIQPGKQPTFMELSRMKKAKLGEFRLLSKFKFGYRNREDKTNLQPGVLIEGSQNVITDVTGRINSVKGYSLDGASSTVLAPILASFDWQTHVGPIQHLRAGFLTTAANDGKLQFRYVNSAGTVTWTDLLTSLTGVEFQFADWWNATNSQAYLLMVNGGSNIYEWSGGVTTLSSVSHTAISTVGNNVLLTAAGAATGTAPITSYINGLHGTSFEQAIVFASNPTNGQTLILSLNGSFVTFHFVSVIGATAGNVLIGATLADTLTNLAALLVAPGSTTATGVALSGGDQTLVGYLTSVKTNTITKQGATTWAEDGFYVTGTHSVTINGVSYQATGGWDMTTLFGVTPDPTGAGVAGDLVFQTVKTVALSSLSSGPGSAFTIDGIDNLRNQIYLGSLTFNTVYISKVNDYTDYSFATPRVVGEGALVTMDAPWRAFSPQESDMYMAAGQDQWYQTQFTLSADLTKESFQIIRLKTGTQQGPQTQAMVWKDPNNVTFISNEPAMNFLGRVNKVLQTVQITNLSNPIINDFNQYDFTDASGIYFQKMHYVAVPNESLIRIYNMTDPRNIYWESPVLYPISRFSIIDGELYGHGYLTSESYKLFDGYTFNAHPYTCIAQFSYDNYGIPHLSKSFNRHYMEGYITEPTTLNVTFSYDVDMSQLQALVPFKGTNSAVDNSTSTASLGKEDEGKNPLGGDLQIATNTSTPPKFRVYQTSVRTPFYEESTIFSSMGVNQHWSILRFGPNQSSTSEESTDITQ